MMNPEKYDLSLTGASLRLTNMLKTAEAIKEESDFDFINELGRGNSRTGKRLFREMKKRIFTLTPRQLSLFLNSSLTTQKQLGFLAICKCFALVRDFVIEVLREKFLLYDYEIRDGEYWSFFRKKSEMHPELEQLAESSQKKTRQVIFRILEEAGIIDNTKSKIIQPQLLDTASINAIVADNPDWLKVFFFTDSDMEACRVNLD